MYSSSISFALLVVAVAVVASDDSNATRVFTVDELAQYDGSDADKPIYLSLKGVVYDVSTGKDFYGKDAGYNILVGRDSTVAIARMSLEKKDLDLRHDVSALSAGELKALEEVITTTYARKYPVVGHVDFTATLDSSSAKQDDKVEL